jgi:hypothetical protein
VLGPLERANLSNWTEVGTSQPFHLRTETDPVSETLLFRIRDGGQSPESLQSKCFTPLS